MKSVQELVSGLREMRLLIQEYVDAGLHRTETTRELAQPDVQSLRDAEEGLEELLSDRNNWKSSFAVVSMQKARAWSVMKNAPHDGNCAAVRFIPEADILLACNCWKADLKAALEWKKEENAE